MNTSQLNDLELEKLVAKRVFQSVDPHRVFRYADNLNDAHRVIEHMRNLGLVVRLDNGLDGTWEATFYKSAETAHGPNDQFYAPENTLARAICVSALKAVHAPEVYDGDDLCPGCDGRGIQRTSGDCCPLCQGTGQAKNV